MCGSYYKLTELYAQKPLIINLYIFYEKHLFLVKILPPLFFQMSYCQTF